MGHKCSEFTPPVLNLGAHVAPLGMKFYTGSQFPAEYKNAILLAEHGSWNRHKYQGARIMRINAGPDGKNAKQLTKLGGVNTYAAWSHDGKEIAFHHSEDNKGKFQIMDADGGNQRELLKDETQVEGGRPAWKPK